MKSENMIRECYRNYVEEQKCELIAVEHNIYSTNFGIVKDEDAFHLCYIDLYCNVVSIRAYFNITDAFKAFAALVQDIEQTTTYPF